MKNILKIFNKRLILILIFTLNISCEKNNGGGNPDLASGGTESNISNSDQNNSCDPEFTLCINECDYEDELCEVGCVNDTDEQTRELYSALTDCLSSVTAFCGDEDIVCEYERCETEYTNCYGAKKSLGEDCNGSIDCDSGICVLDPYSMQPVCSQSCDLNVTMSCPDGYSCTSGYCLVSSDSGNMTGGTMMTAGTEMYGGTETPGGTEIPGGTMVTGGTEAVDNDCGTILECLNG